MRTIKVIERLFDMSEHELSCDQDFTR